MAPESRGKRPETRGQRPDRQASEIARDVDRAERGEHPGLSGERIERDVFGLEGWPDRRIAQVAAAQRTVISRRQLVTLGIGSDMIDRALARGRLHHMHRGVYSLVPSPALPQLAREQAAVLACGADALLSHHSAAAAWGVSPAFIGDVDITVIAKETGRRRPGIRVHRTEQLNPRDAGRHQRLPITSPARTLLDIASIVSDRSLERAIDEALIQRLVTHAAIAAVLARYPGREGTARLKALADAGRPTFLTRSEGEEVLLELLRRGNLPIPEVNARLGRYRVDFLWRAEKVVLELDGYDYHRGRFAFERDRRRDAEHQLAGFTVIRITARQLAREPEAVLVQLATALARRRIA